METPLWYNFQTFPYVYYPVITFLESPAGDKNFLESILIRKSELILQGKPG